MVSLQRGDIIFTSLNSFLGEFNEDEEAQPPTPTSGTSSAHVIGEDEAPMSLISPSEYEDEHGGLRNPLITGSLNFITDSIGRRRKLDPGASTLPLIRYRMARSVVYVGLQSTSYSYDAGPSRSSRKS